MTSSETPGTISRVILGAIVAAISVGILIGLFTGTVSEGLSQEKGDLRDMVEDINSVCEARNSASGTLSNLGDNYEITKGSQNNQIVLLGPSGESEASETVDCEIEGDFSVSDYYNIKIMSEDPPKVQISGGSRISQGGGF